MKIAVDAMGGDHAPDVVVEGAVNAAEETGHHVLLVGRTDAVRPLLDRRMPRSGKIEIVEASDVIEMDEQPAQAVRRKPGASMVICAELVRDDVASGMFSAGNTGACMAVCLLRWGRIRGIDRPALAIPLPNLRGYGVLLDAGANVDVPAACFAQFAVMGSVYAHEVLGIQEPKVGLVNIGEEEGKGNEQARAAFQLLRAAPVNFVGNVEGPDLFMARVDVAVCDGFTGNVLLKAGEGLAELMMTLIRAELKQSFWLRLPSVALRPAFARVKGRLDYAEQGGAPLLGVNGVCIIGHGRSHSRAVANAIRTVGEAVRHGIVERIRDRVAD